MSTNYFRNVYSKVEFLRKKRRGVRRDFLAHLIN
jgi:hypothetical protein